MDQRGKGSFPSNEEAYYRSPIAYSTLGKENLVCILGSVGRSCSGGLSLGSTERGKGGVIILNARDALGER
uniref:Uncharacterized protein n=1 Tax=Tanacetum cinerariifolium TaxID=118510 RepID=A0A699TFJ9_TANCI|nr:hypothetical protein [Tanacetum cinerariifolium]